MVRVFQSPEKKSKSVDHTVVQNKSNTDSMLQQLMGGGGWGGREGKIVPD